MGVTGLWETIKDSGKEVSHASLRNKTLAVDVSLWMYQTVNGIHERSSVDTADAHLILLFNRICILLKNGIKPIFVFDGVPPDLKLRVLQKRRELQYPVSEDGDYFRASQISVPRNRIRQIGLQSQFVLDIDMVDRTENLSNANGHTKLNSVEVNHVAMSAKSLQTRVITVEDSPPRRSEVGGSVCHPHGKVTSKPVLPLFSALNKKEESENDFEEAGPSVPRRQPRRSCRSDWFDENPHDSQDYGVFSSQGSHGTLPSEVDNSDDDVQFISETQRITPRKLVEYVKPEEDFLEVPLVSPARRPKKFRKANMKTQFQIQKTEHGFRLASPSSSVPVKTGKIFPMFLKAKGPAAASPPSVTRKSTVPHSKLGLAGSSRIPVSPEKRKECSPAAAKGLRVKISKETSENEPDIPSQVVIGSAKLSLPRALSPPLSRSVGLSQLKDSENNRALSQEGPSTATVVDLSDDARNDSFSEKEMQDDFWQSLCDSPPTMPAGTGDLLLEDVISQVDLGLGSQNFSQPTRQRCGPSLPLPENLRDNFQHLMNLFGVPFVTSPCEAEAQCAFLESSGVTAGTVTDDGDVLLFGGTTVYRSCFAKTGDPKKFCLQDIVQLLELNRDKLIAFALLTGCDYCDGIRGVGPIKAMEIMAEFGGSGVDSLKHFRNWLNSERELHDNDDASSRPKLKGLRKSLLSSIVLPKDFPSPLVVSAFYQPEIDTTRRKYTLGRPSFNELTQFARQKFGWDEKKIQKLIQPLRGNCDGIHGKQLRMDEMFKVDMKEPAPLMLSQRMGKAVRKLKGSTEPSPAGCSQRRPPLKKSSKK